MGKTRQRRKRGVILTSEGLQSLKQARAKSEYENNFGERYTYEKLSELANLDLHTVKRILNAKKGSDKRSLEHFFMAFGLELTEEDYAQPNPHKRQHWGEAISVLDFLGRTEEIIRLKQWLLKDKCRVATILGMGGVGKTSLSIELARQIQDRFDCVIWRSLRDAPPLDELLVDLIQFLSEEQVTETELPESIGGRISCLVDCLRSSRCLVVLDNLESLLRSNGHAGLFREGYEGYGELIRRLGETEHQSCLLLTSREKPKPVAALEGQMLPTRTFRLKGLREKEAEEILKVKGINGSDTELSKLVQHYEGNALALKVVSTTISELFEGKIAEFLREEISVFGDIRNLLDQQFKRLSDSEKEIIYWLAINREPTTLSQLREDMISIIPRLNLIEGLESLLRRSLIERNESGFTLQSVVMEYVTCCLIEKVCQEVNTKKLALFRCYALMKATAKDYVRETQIRLIVQPVIEGLFALFRCEKSVTENLTQILEVQRETSPREPGYTAGNIINLLCQMETDLTGYDFSNLCVWQADLRNACLHDVNFQNADLAKSVFVETFGGVMSVAFSPDGKLLAAGDTKGEIRLRKVADGQQILTFKGHTNWVTSVAFSPDDNMLASSSIDYSVKLWDASTGQCIQTLQEHENEVWSVAFSPDGKFLASGSDDRTIKLWDVSTGKCLKTFNGHTNWVCSIAFIANGQMSVIVSGSNDHAIKLWNISTGECFKTLRGHSDGIRAITVSPDGQMLASSSEDQTVKLWDVSTGKCLKTFDGHSYEIYSVAFSPRGDFLASGSHDQTVKLWDVSTGKCLKTFNGHSSWVYSVAFSPQGNFLASGSYDQTLKLWNIHTNQCLKTLQGYTHQALSIVFSSGGQTLASGSHDSLVKLWDVSTGKCLKTFYGHQAAVWSIAFCSQRKMLASGALDQTIKLWDVSTGKCLKTLSGHTNWVWSIASSSDGKLLASTSTDGTLKLWSVSTGECLKTWSGNVGWLHSVTFSPDSRTIASSSQDNTIKLWDLHTGKCLKNLPGHTGRVWSIAFSPNNSTLASGSEDETIRLWNVTTGECVETFKPQNLYECMNIMKVTGLAEATIATLKTLGATSS